MHSYGFNNSFGGWVRASNGGGKGGRAVQVKSSSTKLCAMDWPSHSIEQGFNQSTITHPHHFCPGAGAYGCILNTTGWTSQTYAEQWGDAAAGRHGLVRSGLRNNVLFMDGHVETLMAKDTVRQYHFAGPTSPATFQYTAQNNIFNLWLRP
jgi:prepilin-type processing-associated H-X9-DG protein